MFLQQYCAMLSKMIDLQVQLVRKSRNARLNQLNFESACFDRKMLRAALEQDSPSDGRCGRIIFNTPDLAWAYLSHHELVDPNPLLHTRVVYCLRCSVMRRNKPTFHVEVLLTPPDESIEE